MAAPSAMTKDPWRFVVIRDPQMLPRLAAALPGGKMLPAASMAIVVCGDLEAAFDRQLSFLLQDCSAAIENLLLCAHVLGLGACWVGVHPSEEACRQLRGFGRLAGAAQARNFFECPESRQVHGCLFAIGRSGKGGGRHPLAFELKDAGSVFPRGEKPP